MDESAIPDIIEKPDVGPIRRKTYTRLKRELYKNTTDDTQFVNAHSVGVHEEPPVPFTPLPTPHGSQSLGNAHRQAAALAQAVHIWSDARHQA